MASFLVMAALTVFPVLLTGSLVWLERNRDQFWQASWQGRLIKIYQKGKHFLRVTIDDDVLIEEKIGIGQDVRRQKIMRNSGMGEVLLEVRVERGMAHLLMNGEDIPLVEAPRSRLGFAQVDQVEDPLVFSNPEFEQVEDERWNAAQQLMEAIRHEVGHEWSDTIDQIYGTLRGLIHSRARLVASREAYAALGTEGADFEELIHGLDVKIQNLTSGLQKLHFAALNHNLSAGNPALEEISDLLLKLRADVEIESSFSSVQKETGKKNLARRASNAREKSGRSG